MVSPVTYSVASLFKRVFVIIFAIVWFGNSMTAVQGFGIGLTFLGLYLYDRTSDASKADRRAARLQARHHDPLLPVVLEKRSDGHVLSASPSTLSNVYSNVNGGPPGANGDLKKV
jgi:solute carrier family 35, member E1